MHAIKLAQRLGAVSIALTFACAPARAGDLLQVWRAAVEHDAQFASARAQLAAGREKLPQGRAGLLPSVNLAASTVWNDLESQRRNAGAPSVGARYNTNGWSVQLTQPLLRWQNWLAYQQAELAVTLAEQQFAAARQDLVLRVAQAYFDVLAAQEALATAGAQKTAFGEQLAAAKRNFEVGTATITDTHEAQARFDLAVAQELVAENDLAVKRQSLRLLTGKDWPSLMALKVGVGIGRPQPEDMNQWAASAETGHPTVQQAATALEIATREVERQKAGHYPTLDLVASHARNSASGGLLAGVQAPGSDNRATTIGLQLAVPLYAGGAITARERETNALREKALAELENARRQAALAARQAYLGVTSGLAQIAAFEAALASSQLAVEANKLGYEVGVRINIDVLNAQSQLFETRLKLVKARLDTLLAQLRLKAAAGSLGEEDLAQINALLQ